MPREDMYLTSGLSKVRLGHEVDQQTPDMFNDSPLTPPSPRGDAGTPECFEITGQDVKAEANINAKKRDAWRPRPKTHAARILRVLETWTLAMCYHEIFEKLRFAVPGIEKTSLTDPLGKLVEAGLITVASHRECALTVERIQHYQITEDGREYLKTLQGGK